MSRRSIPVPAEALVVSSSYPLRHDLRLGIQANNLFDRVYYTRLGGTNTYHTFGEPRRVNVFMRWQR